MSTKKGRRFPPWYQATLCARGRRFYRAAGTELLRPAAEYRLRMWPMSRRVNKTGDGDDDPTLIEEAQSNPSHWQQIHLASGAIDSMQYATV